MSDKPGGESAISSFLKLIALLAVIGLVAWGGYTLLQGIRGDNVVRDEEVIDDGGKKNKLAVIDRTKFENVPASTRRQIDEIFTTMFAPVRDADNPKKADDAVKAIGTATTKLDDLNVSSLPADAQEFFKAQAGEFLIRIEKALPKTYQNEKVKEVVEPVMTKFMEKLQSMTA